VSPGSSAQEAVKRGPEHMTLKNYTVRSHCHRKVDEDTAGWKKAWRVLL
jgi:hypothetical protein